MRSGSNYIERLINLDERCCCYGEVLNSKYVGLHQHGATIGPFLRNSVDLRNNNINLFFKYLKEFAQGRFWGFRIFDNHNDHYLNKFLANNSIKKIILQRDILESFVSLSNARRTNIWIIENHQKEKLKVTNNLEKLRIDFSELKKYHSAQKSFHESVLKTLSANGESYYLLDYKNINDHETIRQMFKFLDISEPQITDKNDIGILKQSSKTLPELIANYPETINYYSKLVS